MITSMDIDLLVLLTSLLLTLTSFYLLSPFLSKKYFKQYNSFTEDKKNLWNALPGSTISSILLCIITSMGLIFDSTLKQTTSAFLASNICTGFLIGDFIIIMSHSSQRSNRPIIFHHIVSICLVYILVRLMKGRWITSFLYRLLSLEVSTPFLNLRWFICETISPSKLLFVLAKGIMTVTFILSRIFTIPFLWHMVFDIVGDSSEYSSIYGIVFCGSLNVLLDCVNIFWACRIVNSWLDVIKKRKFRNRY